MPERSSLQEDEVLYSPLGPAAYLKGCTVSEVG